MTPQSVVGVSPQPGREEAARALMAKLGYDPDVGPPWFVPFTVDFPEGRRDLIARLNDAHPKWREIVTIGDLQDHPNA